VKATWASGNAMQDRIDQQRLTADLLLPWAITGMMLVTLAATIIICHTLGKQVQQPLPEDQRVLVRTVLYGVAIVTFPVANLIRHIQLRLAQTMPVIRPAYDKAGMPEAINNVLASAKSRYLTTILVSVSLIESVGIYGLVMFMLGDGFNTLYIFIGMSVLGLLLYRPKRDEYDGIVEALVRAER